MLRIIALLIAGWYPWFLATATAQAQAQAQAQKEPARSEVAPFRGKLVLFGAQRIGTTGTGIFTMCPDGTDIETVLEEKEPIAMFGRISPDGKRLAYSMGTGGDQPIQVEILEAGGKRRRVDGDVWVKAWSSDGGSLLGFKPVDGGWESAIVDIASGEVRSIPLPKDDAAEDWSPIGDRISIMVGNRDHVVRRAEDDIYPLRKLDLATPDGSERRRLTTDPETDNIWSRFSPDGTKVAHYQRRIVDGQAIESIIVRGIDGSHPVEVLRLLRVDGALKIVDADLSYPCQWTPTRGPCWSPDGARIAVFLDNGKWKAATRASGKSRFALMIVTLDGRVERAWDLEELGFAFPGTLDWR